MAGYAGYLVKVNAANGQADYTIPFSMIFTESYTVSKNDQDIDSYVDADGNLQRNALAHWRGKVEWTIPPMRKNPSVENFFAALKARYISEVEKSLNLTVYVPEIGDYHTGKFYLKSSVEFPIYRATASGIQYKAIEVSFVEY